MSEVIIPIRIQDEGSAASLDQLVASFDELANTIDSKPIEVKVDTAPAQASVDELLNQIDTLDSSAKPITLTANDTEALASIDAVEGRYATVKATIDGEPITPVVANAAAETEVEAVQATYDGVQTTIQGDPIVLRADNALADSSIAATQGEVDTLQSTADAPMVLKVDSTLADSDLALTQSQADTAGASVSGIGMDAMAAVGPLMLVALALGSVVSGINDTVTAGDKLYQTKAGLDAITNGASAAWIAAGKLGSNGLIPESDLIGVAFKAIGTGAVTTAAQFQNLAQDGTALGLATGQGAAGGVDALGRAIESVGNKKMLKNLALDSDEVMSKWKELGDKGPDAAAHWQTAVMSVADAMAQKLDPTIMGQHVAWQQLGVAIGDGLDKGKEQASGFFNDVAQGLFNVKKAFDDSNAAVQAGGGAGSTKQQGITPFGADTGNQPGGSGGLLGADAATTQAALAKAFQDQTAATLKASGGLATWETQLESAFPITSKSAQSQADLVANVEKAAEAYQKGVGPIDDVMKAMDDLAKGYVATDTAATKSADSTQKAADAAQKFTAVKQKQIGIDPNDDKPPIVAIPPATTDSYTKTGTAVDAFQGAVVKVTAAVDPAATKTDAFAGATSKLTVNVTGLSGMTLVATGLTNLMNGSLDTAATKTTGFGTTATALPAALLPSMTKSAENVALVTTAAQTAQDTLNNLLKTQGSVTIQVNGVNARPSAQGQ